MPKFTVEHKSDKSPEETFKAVKSFLDKGSEIQKFDAKAQVSFDDSSKSAQINGSQFKADMKVVAAGGGSNVAITVDLPFLLTPFKGKVEEQLKKMLTKHLA